MTTEISAKIVADSINTELEDIPRLITMEIVLPRIILAEFNTHRMFSSNTSSSRAIPLSRMIESVEKDPFIPMAWQKKHSGMQGKEYLSESESDLARSQWLKARDSAVSFAKSLDDIGATKQLANRLLEPFMWTKMLVTGTFGQGVAWENLFNLRGSFYPTLAKNDFLQRCAREALDFKHLPKEDIKKIDKYFIEMNQGEAEIHFRYLAELMEVEISRSTPKVLGGGQWHIPYEEYIRNILDVEGKLSEEDMVKVSTSMAARASYTTVGNESAVSIEKHLKLEKDLRTAEPLHASPMEHASQAMYKEDFYSSTFSRNGWCRNFYGFFQYRALIENHIEEERDEYFN